MISNEQKRILIAPLDWGLGHTTRCVPIIRWLQQRGHQAVFAGNEWQRRYINESFNDIETIHLDGYEVTYSKRGSGFMFSLFYQMPRLVRTIRKEHDWLIKLTASRHIDGIISDNRYGLFHPVLPCVMLTHQLLAQSGMGDAADQILRRIHYKYINRFKECWVVDITGSPNLSGKLGHPSQLPERTKYIGLLSQLGGEQATENKEDYLLILLSGPEPQRSILSAILWEQVSKRPSEKVIFVEGSNRAVPPARIPPHIAWHGQLTSDKLLPLVMNASIIVCRSGYSTLMDLAALDKKAILIPTPGQTEQEYLGKHLHKEGVFYCMEQKRFDLQHALTDAMLFPFKKLELHGAHQVYNGIMEDWIRKI